jgi:hypothetical protein
MVRARNAPGTIAQMGLKMTPLGTPQFGAISLSIGPPGSSHR